MGIRYNITKCHTEREGVWNHQKLLHIVWMAFNILQLLVTVLTNRPHGDDSGQQSTSYSTMDGPTEEARHRSVARAQNVVVARHRLDDLTGHPVCGVSTSDDRVRRWLWWSHAVHSKLQRRKRSLLELRSFPQNEVQYTGVSVSKLVRIKFTNSESLKGVFVLVSEFV